MSNKIIIGKGYLPGAANISKKQPVKETKSSFKDVLNSSVDGQVKISKHAEDRIKHRNINVDMDSLKDAVSRAEAKGVRESLILTEDAAFIVNIKNKTVITALTNSELKENIFTNIDGAVIV